MTAVDPVDQGKTREVNLRFTRMGAASLDGLERGC
jgi:hypothetical protein